MRAFKTFKIIWIDDQFSNEKFQKKIEAKKIEWNSIFEKKDSKIYRLFDINFKWLLNGKQVSEFIKDEEKFLDNVFYFFIIDRYLPLEDGCSNVAEQTSIDIIEDLKKLKEKYNSLEYVMLSSAAPESYKITDIDYYRKYSNEEFSLPNELADKILFLIKNKINLINFTDIEYKLNSSEQKGSANNVFPYIDMYKDFIDLQELNSSKENMYYIITPKSTSDEFIIQNLFVIFFDYVKFYQYKINYFNLDQDNKNNSELLKYIENHQLVVIRDKWDKNKFHDKQELLNKLWLNTKLVYIFDEGDESLSYYLEQNKRAKIIKINNLKNNNLLAEKIMFLFLDYFIRNEIKDDLTDNKDKTDKIQKLLTNMYYKNQKLLLHPILYRAIVNQEIHREELDDPIEIFDTLSNYIDEFSQIKNKLFDVQPNTSDQNNNIYEFVNKIYDDKYESLLIDTIKFWLTNSWNVPYNIKLEEKDEKKWQEISFNILKELLEEYKNNQNISEVDDKKIIDKVNTSVDIFNNIKTENTLVLTSKIQWPHNEFPMPLYMIDTIDNEKQIQLYLQHKCMFFINSTEELRNNYKVIEEKMNYYNHIYNLIKATKEFFPLKVNKFLNELNEKIKNGEKIMIKDNKDNFKALAETFIRISDAFFEHKLPDRYGKLGTLLGEEIRKNIIEKNLFTLQNNSFKYDNNDEINNLFEKRKIIKSFCHDLTNSEKKITDYTIEAFINKYSKKENDEILEFVRDLKKEKNEKRKGKYTNFKKKLYNDYLKELKNIENPIIKDLLKLGNTDNMLTLLINTENISTNSIKFDDTLSELDKNYSVEYANFIFNYSIKANISNYLFDNSLVYKILKHYGAYPLLALLTDFRNSSEHKDEAEWVLDQEIFKESFIYGYEYIWKMYENIIKNNWKEKLNKLNELNDRCSISIKEDQNSKESDNYNIYIVNKDGEKLKLIKDFEEFKNNLINENAKDKK